MRKKTLDCPSCATGRCSVQLLGPGACTKCTGVPHWVTIQDRRGPKSSWDSLVSSINQLLNLLIDFVLCGPRAVGLLPHLLAQEGWPSRAVPRDLPQLLAEATRGHHCLGQVCYLHAASCINSPKTQTQHQLTENTDTSICRKHHKEHEKHNYSSPFSVTPHGQERHNCIARWCGNMSVNAGTAFA